MVRRSEVFYIPPIKAHIYHVNKAIKPYFNHSLVYEYISNNHHLINEKIDIMLAELRQPFLSYFRMI